jgi:hypothetical protein
MHTIAAPDGVEVVTGAAARADKNARSGGPYWTSYHAAQSGSFAAQAGNSLL